MRLLVRTLQMADGTGASIHMHLAMSYTTRHHTVPQKRLSMPST